jgi:methionyl-tRNA synthetase
MDLRTGKIVSAEKVKKADKLLHLKVDLGFETRDIVSGIAEHYTADEIIGKKVTVLINLAPRRIRGVESNGMILMAEDQEGQLQFVSTDNDFPHGSVVR